MVRNEHLCEFVEDFFDGEMDAENTREFRLHLERCPACQEKIKDLEMIRNTMQSTHDHELPDEADLRVRHQLHAKMSKSEGTEEILDIEGVALFLKIPVPEVVKLLDQLPAFEIAGRIRFRRDRIMKWLHDQEVRHSWERRTKSDRKIIQFPGG